MEDAREHNAPQWALDPAVRGWVHGEPDENEEIDSEAAVEAQLHTILLGTPWLDRVVTFEDAGVMTYNKGLVITTRSGEEYQLTIIRSG